MKICRRTHNFYLNARLLPWQLTPKRGKKRWLALPKAKLCMLWGSGSVQKWVQHVLQSVTLPKSHGCIAIAKRNHTAALPKPNGITQLHCHDQMESQGCIATAKQNHKTVLTWPKWSTWKFGQCHWLDERAKWRWETVSAVCVRVLRSRLEKGTVQTTDYWRSKQNTQVQS